MWERFLKLNNTIKLIIIQVIITLLLWGYLKIEYGIYKHKYIQELESDKKEFKQRLNDIEIRQKYNRNKTIELTQKLIKDANEIETNRIKDEKHINDFKYSDMERKEFLARFER